LPSPVFTRGQPYIGHLVEAIILVIEADSGRGGTVPRLEVTRHLARALLEGSGPKAKLLKALLDAVE